jgi:hypothetical protein
MFEMGIRLERIRLIVEKQHRCTAAKDCERVTFVLLQSAIGALSHNVQMICKEFREHGVRPVV